MVESPLLLLLHDSSLKDEPGRYASERVSDGHTWPEAFAWPAQWMQLYLLIRDSLTKTSLLYWLQNMM